MKSQFILIGGLIIVTIGVILWFRNRKSTNDSCNQPCFGWKAWNIKTDPAPTGVLGTVGNIIPVCTRVGGKNYAGSATTTGVFTGYDANGVAAPSSLAVTNLYYLVADNCKSIQAVTDPKTTPSLTFYGLHVCYDSTTGKFYPWTKSCPGTSTLIVRNTPPCK